MTKKTLVGTFVFLLACSCAFAEDWGRFGGDERGADRPCARAEYDDGLFQAPCGQARSSGCRGDLPPRVERMRARSPPAFAMNGPSSDEVGLDG